MKVGKEYLLIFLRHVFCLLACGFFAASAAMAEKSVSADFDQLSARFSAASSEIGISIVELESGKKVYARNPDKALIPASTLKLLTSVAALKRLGPNFVFSTQVYQLSSGKNLKIGITGGADPEFSTEDIYLMGRKLKAAGLVNIAEIVLDDSELEDPLPTQGDRSYEAGGGALIFNYNSSGFFICPSAGQSNNAMTVNPLLTEDGTEIKFLSSSASSLQLSRVRNREFKLQGSNNLKSACFEDYLSNPNPKETLVKVVKSIFEESGLGKNIIVRFGRVREGANLIFEIDSRPLSQILYGLLRYSTNVTAEQILGAIGFDNSASSKLSRARGLRYLQNLAGQMGLRQASIVDGSGLNRENRISAEGLTIVLEQAWKNPAIRPYLESSLTVSGLKQRTTEIQKEPIAEPVILTKSGTLNEVSALAGYIYASSGKTYAFSVIQNSVFDLAKAKELQQSFIKEVASSLALR